MEVGLKLFFIWALEMVVGPLWKYRTYTLQMMLGFPLKARHIHITVAVGGTFESKIILHQSWCLGPFDFESVVLAHYSCCWESLWEQGTYTL